MKRSNVIILSVIGFLAVIFAGYLLLLVLTTPRINFPKTIITKAEIIQRHGEPVSDNWLYSGKIRRKVNILTYHKPTGYEEYFFINNRLLNITDNYVSYLTSLYELWLIDPVVYRVKVDEFQGKLAQAREDNRLAQQQELERGFQQQISEQSERQQKLQRASLFMGLLEGMQNRQALRGIQKSIERPRRTSGTFYNYRTGDTIQYRGRTE